MTANEILEATGKTTTPGGHLIFQNHLEVSYQGRRVHLAIVKVAKEAGYIVELSEWVRLSDISK